MGSSEGHGCPEFLVKLLVSKRKGRKALTFSLQMNGVRTLWNLD